jgi:hypothetical protein
MHKTLSGRHNEKAPVPQGGRDFLLSRDFQCTRQFAFGIIRGPPGTHNPPLTIENPLRSELERLCTPLRTADYRGSPIRPLFHLRVKAPDARTGSAAALI